MAHPKPVPLQAYLDAKDWSHADLAKKTGLKRSTVGWMARGEGSPRLDGAKTVVDYTHENPGPNGEVVTYESLAGCAQQGAA